MKRSRMLLLAGIAGFGVTTAFPFGFSEAHGTKPTAVLFGDGAPRVLRPRIGIAHMAARIVLSHGVDYGPDVTMDEYGAWIDAGKPEDIDGFLEGAR